MSRGRGWLLDGTTRRIGPVIDASALFDSRHDGEDEDPTDPTDPGGASAVTLPPPGRVDLSPGASRAA